MRRKVRSLLGERERGGEERGGTPGLGGFEISKQMGRLGRHLKNDFAGPNDLSESIVKKLQLSLAYSRVGSILMDTTISRKSLESTTSTTRSIWRMRQYLPRISKELIRKHSLPSSSVISGHLKYLRLEG